MTWQRIPMKERIERNCIPVPIAGCWLWTSCLNKNGYGYLHNRTLPQGKHLYAHRASYEEFKGPIPNGMYVCHSCDVPSCVNPAHLWLGTHEENQKDRVAKGRSSKGEGRPNARLNAETVKAIRKASGSYKQIGKQFGIAAQTAFDVLNQRTWKHV